MNNNITLIAVMKIIAFLVIVIVGTIALYKFLVSRDLLTDNNLSRAGDTTISSDSRIASFGPSITELIYKLGLESQLVANTTYCKYPEQAKNITKIGSNFDVNYELLMALKVDVAIIYKGSEKQKATLNNLGIKYIEIDHQSIDGIMESIADVGLAFDKVDEASSLISELNDRLDNASCENMEDKKVIYVIHRDIDFGGMSNITVVGVDTYFNEMIDRAGGINIFSNSKAAYPLVDMETIIRINPDIIFEVYLQEQDIPRLQASWNKMNNINAVINNEVHFLLAEDYSIPSPRFIELQEKMYNTICK